MTLIEQLHDILRDQLGLLDAETYPITDESRLREDLDADWIDRIQLQLALNEQFDIELNPTAVDACETVGNLRQLIERHLG